MTQLKTRSSLGISVILAWIGGILLPLLETIRRFQQITEIKYFLYWFDDYLLGAFLLYAAWRTYKSPVKGRLYLCAAWGATTMMMFLSFLGQLQSLNQPDPAPVSSAMVAVIKGLLLIGALAGLVLALDSERVRSKRNEDAD